MTWQETVRDVALVSAMVLVAIFAPQVFLAVLIAIAVILVLG